MPYEDPDDGGSARWSEDGETATFAPPPRSHRGTTTSARQAAPEQVTAERLRHAVLRPERRRFRMPRANRRPPRPHNPNRTDAPETTTGTMQIAVLALGGLLLAGAAVVLAFYSFAGLNAVSRTLLLALITLGALATPLVLAQRGLRATGETVASVALLLVLLDGYVIRSEGLFGTTAVPRTVYFGLVCMVTAAIAAAYSFQSHLVAPRYATLLSLQPVLPLLAWGTVTGPTGWALVLSGVALIDLIIGVALGRSSLRLLMAGWARRPVLATDPSIVDEPETTTTASRLADELMRNLAWLLYAVAFGLASAYAIVALADARGLPATANAAVVVLLTAAIGVAGSLSWRRGALPDVAGGIATFAVIAAFTRVGAAAFPAHTLLFMALGVTLATIGIPFLPADTRRGPRFTGSATAAAVALLLVVRSLPAIAAPVRAVRPVWHASLTRYDEVVNAATGPHAWQFVVASLLLTVTGFCLVPPRFREDVISVGVPFAALVAPSALRLQWLAAPVLTVIAAVVCGVLALTVHRTRTAWILLAAAAVLGCYAAATSLADPTATALTLTAITLAGTGIAMAPRSARPEPEAELVTRRVTDAAAGGAIFALPGAAAAATAIPFTGVPGGATAVIVISYVALSVSLAVAAITQVIRREQRVLRLAGPDDEAEIATTRPRDAQSPPLLIGATAATAAVIVAAIAADGISAVDYLIALLMLIAAVLLWLAPALDERHTFTGDFTGADAATAAVTVAAIAAFARAVSLAAPGAELVTVAVIVLGIALIARNIPDAWRRGLVAGGAIVGALAGLYAAVVASAGAVGVIRAVDHIWRADLVHWREHATQVITFGWQIPLALLLLAVAAGIGLRHPHSDNAASAGIALAAMAAPIGLRLGWQSPMVLGWLAATGIGAWAVLGATSRAAYTRLVAAGVVGVFAAGASLVRPEATAATLVALTASAAGIAGLAGSMIKRDEDHRASLAVVGGTATAAALLGVCGAVAALAGALHPGAPAALILTATLAAGGAGLAVGGLIARPVPAFLAYVTAGVAAGATTAALVALFTDRRSAVVFAAVAALLGVLAELVRVGNDGAPPTWLPTRTFRPDRTSRQVLGWRLATPNGFTSGVLAAAGLPAAIVVVFVAPTIMAAWFGPYRWVSMPWTGSPADSSDLGAFARFVGNGTHVLALAILTLAAALTAVGLGGGRTAIINRCVAILVPGLSLTLVIAPPALHWPWPWQPTVALLVATFAGLGLALTVPPPPTREYDGLRIARRVTFVIALLSGMAGCAGSLAVKQQTITWLATSVVVGLIGAVFGRFTFARMVGWQVAASSAEGLALAAGLAAGLPARQCAFLVLFVATLALILAALLPRLRERQWAGAGKKVGTVGPAVSSESAASTSSVRLEAATLELTGYAGALGALLLTWGWASHTAAVLTALGAVLGVSAARPGRTGAQRVYLIIAAAVSELIAIWLLLITVRVALPEAYTLPFAVIALITGLLQIRSRPELGSWIAYGPALVAGFLPSLVLVLMSESLPLRRVLLIVAAVTTVAIGAQRRQKAPVAVGAFVTILATLHELLVAGLPWPILLLLFVGTGALLVGVGANYEGRRRLRGAYRGMR